MMNQKNNKEHKKLVTQFGETTPTSGGTIHNQGNSLFQIGTISLIGTWTTWYSMPFHNLNGFLFKTPPEY